MLEILKELFRGESLLDQAYEETVAILGVARDMTLAASNSLRHSDSVDDSLDLYKTDKTINKYERETRRKVLTHLAVSTAADYAPALVLTSIVIDVERIGDYAKNILELARAHPRALPAYAYEDRVQRLEERVRIGFGRVSEAFQTSDEQSARAFMTSHDEFSRLADGMVEEMITRDDGVPKSEAVALALYVRYLKRIEAHLTNIVSSVVNPFPRIGFRNKEDKAAGGGPKPQ